jgi:hypothetical protein
MRTTIPRVIGLLAQGGNGVANPPYGVEDFYNTFPQFFNPPEEVPDGGGPGPPVPLVPMAVLQMYINLAHSCISYAIFRDAWFLCMGLFIAHWLTLYLQTADDPLAGETTGLISSKSVDGVSVSYDNNAVTSDMEGFGMYKSTSYGEQLATWAKLMGLGGLYVR